MNGWAGLSGPIPAATYVRIWPSNFACPNISVGYELIIAHSFFSQRKKKVLWSVGNEVKCPDCQPKLLEIVLNISSSTLWSDYFSWQWQFNVAITTLLHFAMLPPPFTQTLLNCLFHRLLCGWYKAGNCCPIFRINVFKNLKLELLKLSKTKIKTFQKCSTSNCGHWSLQVKWLAFLLIIMCINNMQYLAMFCKSYTIFDYWKWIPNHIYSFIIGIFRLSFGRSTQKIWRI